MHVTLVIRILKTAPLLLLPGHLQGLALAHACRISAIRMPKSLRAHARCQMYFIDCTPILNLPLLGNVADATENLFCPAAPRVDNPNVCVIDL